MTSISNALTIFVRSGRLAVAMALLFLVTVSPSFAAVQIPDNDDQDVLIRTTLMTFNDANMTNNYAVFHAKASKEFQAQFAVDKIQAAFEVFRSKELFFEDVVTADYDSYEKTTLDNEGALVLIGVFKTDDMQVKYRLRFIQNNKVWKMLGLNVDATRKKQ
jgi:hypothetical protein